MKWKEFEIGEVAHGIFDGPHATPKEASKGAIFLGIRNITEDCRLDLSDIRFISLDELPKWTKRVKPEGKDIVFSYEATLHRYAIIPEGFEGCLGRRMALIRPDFTKVDHRFLYFYLRSENWKKEVTNYIITGSTVDRIPILNFPKFKVQIPPLATQQKIASILSAYDDLIENNLKRIKLLEEAAQHLYREWFVKGRFPGWEAVRVVDGLPEGWEKRSLSDLCSNISDGTHDSPKPKETGYYLVTGKCIVNGFIDFNEAYKISEEDHQAIQKRSFLDNGDILYSNIGTIGSTTVVEQDFGFSCKNVIIFKPKIKHSIFLYYFLTNDYNKPRFLQGLAGSNQKFISLKYARGYEYNFPTTELIEIFDEKIEPLFKQKSILNKQNQRLKEARDLLLPRLMNQSIEV